MSFIVLRLNQDLKQVAINPDDIEWMMEADNQTTFIIMCNGANYHVTADIITILKAIDRQEVQYGTL
jgi:elongation factor P hydroxylase